MVAQAVGRRAERRHAAVATFTCIAVMAKSFVTVRRKELSEVLVLDLYLAFLRLCSAFASSPSPVWLGLALAGGGVLRGFLVLAIAVEAAARWRASLRKGWLRRTCVSRLR